MDPMDPPAGSVAVVCRLCGTPRPDPGARCPACGLHPVRNLSRATKWRLAGGLLALYAFVAVVLLLAR